MSEAHFKLVPAILQSEDDGGRHEWRIAIIETSREKHWYVDGAEGSRNIVDAFSDSNVFSSARAADLALKTLKEDYRRAHPDVPKFGTGIKFINMEDDFCRVKEEVARWKQHPTDHLHSA